MDLESSDSFAFSDSSSGPGFKLSVRRSRRRFQDLSGYISNGLATLSSKSEGRTTVQIMIDQLRTSGLPGPVPTSADDLRRTPLGQGAQFVVYRGGFFSSTATGSATYAVDDWPVAIKKPKFTNAAFSKFSFAGPEAQKQLQSIWLEILALTHPHMREHPNIVNLIAWSSDPQSPIKLVMELASYDLEAYLKEHESAKATETKYLLCVDAAAGLDELHKSGLVHGDLKSQNILLFEDHGRFVAKLTDFGLAFDENELKDDPIVLGGTIGWEAPEVQEGRGLTRRNVPLADNYSYGLIIWSVFLHRGECPTRTPGTSRQEIALQELEQSEAQIGQERFTVLHEAVRQCLQHESRDRPLTVLLLFPDGVQLEQNLISQEEELQASRKGDEVTDQALETLAKQYDPFRKSKHEDWEPDPFSKYYVDDLLTCIQKGDEGFSRETYFDIFLHLASRLRDPTIPDATVLNLLVKAASLGARNAQSMVSLMHHYYGIELPESLRQNHMQWLKRAVSDGSLLGKWDLQHLNHREFSESIEKFRSQGGYNWNYFRNHRKIRDTMSGKSGVSGWTKLHQLAACGTVDEVREYVKQGAKDDIDTLTSNGETALYLASARGCWEISKELLLSGADPAKPCTRYGITCLHWLFCFDEEIQDEAVIQFISHGADIDATAQSEMPFLHYPFVLPAGTPLHWAVITSSRTAIRALFDHGADVLVRDGSDPYVFDARVRYLNKFGGPNEQAYSLPEIKTMGLSSLDLSVMQRDPYLFRLVRSSKQRINIDAGDEEGFSVLHRLSADEDRITRLGNVFSSAPFKGTWEEARRGLREIVEIVRELGGNFDLLTTTTTSEAQNFRPSDILDQTPLMLAMRRVDVDVVKALLDNGANPNIENKDGATAIHYLGSNTEDSKVRCVQLLASHKADLNHRSKSGATLVTRGGLSPDVVDALLAKGVSIEMVNSTINAIEYGQSLWMLLAAHNEPSPYIRDREVARLLEKHVFSLQDTEKIRRVIDYADQCVQ